MMPHVRTTVNRSPTMMVLRSVFQKHLIGSTSTSPGCRVCWNAGGTDDVAFAGGFAGAFAAGVGAGGAWAAAGAASATRTENKSENVVFIDSLHFPQSTLPSELDERGFHFPAIEPDFDEVEVVIARDAPDVFLPLLDARRHARQLAPRHDSSAAGFDV